MASQPTYLDEAPEQMDDTELVSILKQHETQAIGYQPGGQDEISSEQQRAINYYYGIMDDVPAQEGCSSVCDRTVQVVVDNALAALLKPFLSSDETVSFTPRSQEDIESAEQATEYINFVLNYDNPGPIILYNWFKDAALTKLGIVKVWWEDREGYDKQDIELQDEMHASIVRMQPNYLGEQDGIASLGHAVNNGRIKVENVPPEEFRITPLSRSVEDAIYTAHVPMDIIRGDLIEMGFDPEIIETLPAISGSSTDNTLRLARYQDERIGDESLSAPHSSQERVALRDEYIRIDYDGDGVAELRRIVRVDDTILLNEVVDENPFATLCPIPMPHKVFGLSLADLAIEDQKINTVLWRQTLDNLYKSNNPRPIVGQGAERSDGSTIDTLNDNAPGAGILVQDVTQFRYDAVPFSADKSFPMLEYVSAVTEQKTGISKTGQGLDTNALKKTGQMTATEMALIAGGKNARTEMVARIFAETGVKRLFLLMAHLLKKHQQQERIIRLRNKFVPINPAGWPEMDLEVSVGLGVGDKTEQLALADSVLETMAQLAQSPYGSMVTEENAYNAVKRKFTAAGIKNPDDYLTEPPKGPDGNPLPKEPQKSPEQIKAEGDLALQAQKQQSDQQAEQAKMMLQAQAQEHSQQLAREQAQFEAELATAKAEREAQLAQQKMALEAALAEQRMDLEERMAQRKASLAESSAEAKLSTNRPGGSLAE